MLRAEVRADGQTRRQVLVAALGALSPDGEMLLTEEGTDRLALGDALVPACRAPRLLCRMLAEEEACFLARSTLLSVAIQTYVLLTEMLAECVSHQQLARLLGASECSNARLAIEQTPTPDRRVAVAWIAIHAMELGPARVFFAARTRHGLDQLAELVEWDDHRVSLELEMYAAPPPKTFKYRTNHMDSQLRNVFL